MTRGTATRDESLLRFVLRRGVLVACVVFLCASLVFAYVHLGPNPPVEAGSVEGSELGDKKEAFGLYRPLWVQYGDYLTDMATLDFGQVWSSRFRTESIRQGPEDVNSVVSVHGARTLWLWGWTLLVAVLVGVPLGVAWALRSTNGIRAAGTGPSGASGASRAMGDERVGVLRSVLFRAAPVVLVAPLLAHVLLRSGSLFFGWNWTAWLVETGTLSGPIYFDDLAVAAKRVVPPALALSIPFVATTASLGRRAILAARSAGHVDAARGGGVPPRRLVRRHVLRNAVVPLATTLRRNAAALVGGTIVVEHVFSLEGAGRLFFLAITHGDYTTLQATLFVLFCLLGAVALLQDSLVAWLGGGRTGRERRARACWTASETTRDDDRDEGSDAVDRLRSLGTFRTESSVVARVRANPRPVLLWMAVGGLLFALEAGAVVETIGSVLDVAVPELPTLLDRTNLPNEGYHVPGEGWQGTAFGLSPALALALRVALVGAYALAWVGWLVAGRRLYRSTYRLVDRTPTDRALRRFARRREVVVALAVVTTLFVTALFAPTMAATPVDRTETHADLQGLESTKPNESAQLTYFDEELETVRTTSVGLANMRSKSSGTANSTVAPLSYDDYDRFHPFGTTFSGTDLYSELVVGARVYAFVGAIGVGLVTAIAVALVLVAARVRGRVEGAIEALASTVAALPELVVLFALLETLDRTVVTDATTTLVVMAGLFGVVGWADLWQTLRTPAYRALDGRWRDRCRLVGRTPVGVGRGLHRLAGIVLAYASAAFAGIVLTMTGFAALSSTVWTTTDVWGEFYLYGIDDLTTAAGHTAVVPGVAVVVLVASAIVLADGVRTATETGRVLGTSAPGDAAALGGGG